MPDNAFPVKAFLLGNLVEFVIVFWYSNKKLQPKTGLKPVFFRAI